MKKYIILLFFLTVTFSSLVCTKSENQSNISSNVDSIWEYEPGQYDRMTFTMYKNGKFIYENMNSKKKDEGAWVYNTEHTQIIISFTTNKDYWDKGFFKNDRVLVYKQDVGYYNKNERKVGFIIHKWDKTGQIYINFLGFNYYKK